MTKNIPSDLFDNLLTTVSAVLDEVLPPKSEAKEPNFEPEPVQDAEEDTDPLFEAFSILMDLEARADTYDHKLRLQIADRLIAIGQIVTG